MVMAVVSFRFVRWCKWKKEGKEGKEGEKEGRREGRRERGKEGRLPNNVLQVFHQSPQLFILRH